MQLNLSNNNNNGCVCWCWHCQPNDDHEKQLVWVKSRWAHSRNEWLSSYKNTNDVMAPALFSILLTIFAVTLKGFCRNIYSNKRLFFFLLFQLEKLFHYWLLFSKNKKLESHKRFNRRQTAFQKKQKRGQKTHTKKVNFSWHFFRKNSDLTCAYKFFKEDSPGIH